VTALTGQASTGAAQGPEQQVLYAQDVLVPTTRTGNTATDAGKAARTSSQRCKRDRRDNTAGTAADVNMFESQEAVSYQGDAVMFDHHIRISTVEVPELLPAVGTFTVSTR
jgi:hypothetical protein